MRQNIRPQLLASVSVMCVLAALPAQAANFTIVNGQTVNTTQTIGPGANEVGTVQSGGAVTINNNNALQSTSVGGTLSNSGTITTSGGTADGMNSQSANNTLTNSGTITTSGNNAMGMRATAAATNNTLTNSGTITTSGTNARAILTEAAGITLTSNGTITTSGDGAAGLYSVANNTTLINNGSINTTGATTFGLYSTGTGGTMINNGSITTSNNNANGIYAIAANNTVTNNGTITLTGDSSLGLFSNATNNTLTNNGTITTNAFDTHGIITNTLGTNNNFINNGRIVVNGTSSNAIRSGASGVTITNAGYVRSVQSDTVRMTGANNTLILKANSTVDGTVVYTGGGTNTLQYDVGNTGRGGSVTRITGAISVTGALTESIINTPSGMRAVQSGNTVAVVAADQFGGTTQVVSQTVNDAGNVVNNRQQLALLGDTTESNSGTQYAASGSSMNDASGPHDWAMRDRRVLWAEAFGSYQERGQTSDTSDSIARSGGVLAGMDLPQTSEGVRAGFFAGGFGGALNVGSFKDVNSVGGMAGGYVGKSYGGIYVSGGLNFGFSNNESDRFSGIDTAKSDYTSYFVSPSINVMQPIKKDGYTLIPNATLRYTMQHDGSYNESGSLVNQSVDSHSSHLLAARAMMVARLDPSRIQDSLVATAFRAGVQGQTLLGSNKTNVTVLGNNLSFDPQGGNDTVDAVLGFNVSQSLNAGPTLYFDAEANLGLNNGGPSENKGIVGRLGAKWSL